MLQAREAFTVERVPLQIVEEDHIDFFFRVLKQAAALLSDAVIFVLNMRLREF